MRPSYVLFADGFEEIEALTCIDVLRRAGMPVTTVSINPGLEVTGAHGVTVLADSLFGDSDYEGAEWLVLPGGIPGAPNLAACEPLCDLLTAQDARGGKVAAICASPAVVLAPLGLLQDRSAVCYPGMENELIAAGGIYTDEAVVTDGKMITARAAGASEEFSFELIRVLKGDAAAENVRKSICAR